MIYACARRKSDGLLTWAQGSREKPDQSAIIQNAISVFGGILTDWEYVELTQMQYDTMMAALPGRSYLISGDFSSKSAPQISSDKAQIEDDGADTATISFDVGDVDYNDEVTWKVTTPEGDVSTETENMVAGAASLEITTTLPGTIYVQAETVAHGVGLIEIEGV